MSAALARLPASVPAPPFGARPDLGALEQVIAALDHGHVGHRPLDAEIYAALGWKVDCGPRARIDRGAAAARHRLGWRCRSPLSSLWCVLPHPTGDISAAAALVPWRWSWLVGNRDGLPHAWCRANAAARPGRLPLYAEAQRLTPALSLTVAALHAHRQVILWEMGHG